MSREQTPSPIVIAEDDPFDVLLLKNSLSALGIPNPVVVFDNGADLLTYLDPALAVRVQRASLPPQVLFLDLKMPIIDGFAVIASIRKHPVWAALRIIVVSGTIDPKDAERAFSLGADEFVLKPIDSVLLGQLLADVAPAGVK